MSEVEHGSYEESVVHELLCQRLTAIEVRWVKEIEETIRILESLHAEGASDARSS